MDVKVRIIKRIGVAPPVPAQIRTFAPTMQALGYYIVLPFIYLLSVLPFPLLYLFSDFVYFMLFYVIGYRKDVVLTNLEKSFPEKNEKELLQLRKQFYHYFCDLFLETFKTLTISEKTMLKHCTIDPEATALFERIHAEQKNIIIVMGHYGNWEWAGNTFSLTQKHQLYVIYHPLQHPYFNKLIVDMRMRFGTKLIAMQDTMKQMLANRTAPLNATAFIADQTPHPERAYWMQFMNQDTPVFLGTEKFAMKLGYPVVYVSVRRKRRGYYNIEAELLFENPTALAPNVVTEAHTHKLEKDIHAQPEIWLWSHKRWKHKRPM